MLVKCPECGKQVSDKAASCPNCGNPIAIQVSTFVRAGDLLASKAPQVESDAETRNTCNNGNILDQIAEDPFVKGSWFFTVAWTLIKIVAVAAMFIAIVVKK